MDEHADVLDNGYVRIVDHFGSDLNIVNAARASFMKESKEFGLADDKLIKYLVKKNEWSPFRHAFITFELKAPLMVARQLWKYVVGSDHTMDAWNEASRRYITMEPEFYLPNNNEWRAAPENKKQGSAEPIDEKLGTVLTILMKNRQQQAIEDYNYALANGVAVEIARGFLPAYFMYTVWRWTGSINSICWVLTQRALGEGVQDETSEYAKAMMRLLEPHFPAVLKAFKEHNA